MIKRVIVIELIVRCTILQAESTIYNLDTLEIIDSKDRSSAFNTPATVTTLPQQKLNIAQLQSIQNLSGLISNANISGIGSRMETTMSIRGVSNYVAFESSASIYLDDVPIPFSYGFGAINLHGIDRIELYKGPQGTLYGKSSESGVLNLYTKRPTKAFQSELNLGFGAYNTLKSYADISGAISDKARIFASV